MKKKKEKEKVIGLLVRVRYRGFIKDYLKFLVYLEKKKTTKPMRDK